jgi:hypothetical protein
MEHERNDFNEPGALHFTALTPAIKKTLNCFDHYLGSVR